jgi:hypothetical protein
MSDTIKSSPRKINESQTALKNLIKNTLYHKVLHISIVKNELFTDDSL